MGDDIKQGCEVSIHAIFMYLTCSTRKPAKLDLLKLDNTNAFNYVSCDVMLKQVKVNQVYTCSYIPIL